MRGTFAMGEKKTPSKHKQKTMQTIRDELARIERAGRALADAQFPLYTKKQTDLRQAYTEVLRTAPTEEKGDEGAKMEAMGREKRSAYAREKNSRKHVQAMTKAERERNVANVMGGLFYGLDGEFPAPGGFEALVNTGNKTTDGVNRYMMLCSMQRRLLEAHPEAFQGFQPFA